MQKNVMYLYENGTSETLTSEDCNAEFITAALQANYCTLICEYSQSWNTENSIVTSLPIIDLMQVFNDSLLKLATASVVEINGPLPEREPVHYHLSHVIGMVFEGRGKLIAHLDGEAVSVNPGDLVIIPRGAMHFFETEEGGIMKWIAMELSDRPIDYQKHYADLERSALQ